MKKFYESPIVELTVFDVEDVITASADPTIYINTLAPGADLSALDNEFNDKEYAAHGTYVAGSYNW